MNAWAPGFIRKVFDVTTLGNDLMLGTVVGRRARLMISAVDRSTHVHVVGATGTGKSKFLESMIRQDILNRRRSGSGIMLVDPHGALYDGILSWLTAVDLDLPIVPIDLRRDDWIVSYNLLRKRQKANPSVVVGNIVDAMAYVWGADGTDLTPLFARWASNVLGTLYEKGYTLAEAIHLTDREGSSLRELITRELVDPLARRDWAYARTLTRKDFDTQVSSLINRFDRFLRNDYLRAIFGQSDRSFDLSNALVDGQIVLVRLGTDGARVRREDAEVLATVLLNDLWTAAQERGKSKDHKPFYLYIDEFQKFVTPTISENLDEARGYGLHLTLAHQFPKQLSDRGEAGKRLLNSVMENARTKVVFQLSDEENLMPLAKWLFRGVMDPDQVKHELFSTKVMDYRLQYQQVYSRTTSRSTGGGRNETGTIGETQGGSGEGMGEVEAWSRHASEGASSSETWSDTESESVSDVPMLMPQLGRELSHVQFRSLEEQLFRAMAVLFDQKQRQAVVRLVNTTAPASMFTPTVEDGYVREERVAAYALKLMKRWPFTLSLANAMRAVVVREQEMRDKLLNERTSQDVPTARRVISVTREVPAVEPIKSVRRKLPKRKS